MSDDIEPANVPVFVCLTSFSFGLVAWFAIMVAQMLPATEVPFKYFPFNCVLVLLVAGSLFLGLFGVGLLPYAIFSKTRGPLGPVIFKCGFYLLPAIALGLDLGYRLLLRKGH